MTSGGGGVREFVGTTRQSQLGGWSASLVFAIIPLVGWLSRGIGPQMAWGGPWVWGAAVLASALYYRIVSVRRAVVRLDGATVSVGGRRFLRAGLTVEPRHWIETMYGSGTTEGTALVLRQGDQNVIIGAKGVAPADGLPTTGDVRVVLSAPDFRQLFSALGAGTRGAFDAGAGPGLTIHVAPSSSSVRRRLLLFGPFGAAFAVVVLAGRLTANAPSVLTRPLNEFGLSVVVLAGIVLGVWLAYRPPRANLLRIEGGRATYRGARTGEILASCALQELRVERARHVVSGRFTRFEYPVLSLCWPDGRALVLGVSEWKGALDPGLPRRFRAPPFLIGAGEWDALDAALRIP